MTSATREPATSPPAGLRVTFDGRVHPAEEIAHGAAYELFSTAPQSGFVADLRPDAPYPFHRFVHASEVVDVQGALPTARAGDREAPLIMPVSRAVGWEEVHRRSQSASHRDDPLLAAIRRSATIRRGTRMIKVLSESQLAGYLRGWQPHGFCYREHDVAHLRTPADLALLRTDGGGVTDQTEAAYVLRWRAVGPGDYAVPVDPGLVGMPPRDRVGPPMSGTGFAPSGRHLIPEFVTADFVDLPLTANATLLAYTPDGAEVTLFSYQPEQRGWLRMVGSRWRHLLAAIPGVSPEQEYVSTGEAARSTRLIGTFQGHEHEAVADPPDEFRVLAMTRAARYPVESLTRRTTYATWRGAPVLVLLREAQWTRVRMCRPDAEAVARLGAQCFERGVYEVWAPTDELADVRVVDQPYG
ncbi:hypothetical protein [Polymorphospora rubra]|uniref:Uncharacterized protein n=1 Tax=Polymorphospora rubra TaxID=338584 RepID=A0A810MXN1_9ACTN|nr:hypothetical protein [Polymorphospora rubra]BCJ65842.1 hypothetical protein Prubr_28630 [Polymorphospora rubra]